LCEPLAIGVYAVQQASLNGKSSIAVLGAGPIGLSCILAAKAQGVTRFYVTEKIPERVEVARTTGANWVGDPNNENVVEQILRLEPNGIDVVFECAGQQETLDQAIEILKPGGRLMLIGIPREDKISFVIDKMRRKEITLINVRRQNDCTQKCIELVQNGEISPDFMVTHRFSLDEVQKAFELVAGYRDGVVKAMIEL
jgi:threonine dehydrogenase-like Zn-dependent dehydrogenase